MDVLLPLLAYLVLQFAVVWWVSRRIRNDADYFLAGRSLGPALASISIFATWFGAETCIGSAGAIFGGGLSDSRADPFGYTLCLLIAATFLAAQLWKRKLTTLGDLFRQRYSPGVEKLAVFVMIPSSLIWAAAQIKAFGHILSTALPISLQLAVFAAALFVVVYSALGGMLGDVLTDTIQGVVLVVGLAALLYFAGDRVGGLGAALSQVDPSRLSFTANDESFLLRLDTWMVPVLGSLVAQELISRMLSSRSAGVARGAAFAASGMYLTIGLIPVLLGLLGTSILSPMEDTDQFLPTLGKELLPHGLYVVFIGALISAILSTVNSALLSVSALVTHNVMPEKFKKLSEKKKLALDRGVLALGGLFAYVMAAHAEGIYELVTIASSFGSAGLFVITFGGLWLKGFGTPRGAAAALVTGLLATPFAEYGLEFEAPFLFSIFSAALVYAAVSVMGHRLPAWK
ncbi:MAG: sodium:solute symporter family protein [Bdellovibrionales bacterium]|nr:sodium:solute symporter family protein [Bdellovibrionales bacterium]